MQDGRRYDIDADASFLVALSKQNLGNSFELSSTNTTIDREICRVQMPTQFACGWVVTLGQPTRSVAGTRGTFAFATVAWGMAGVQHQVELDWSQGIRFGLYGSQVTVRLKASAIAKATLAAGPIRYAASVSLGSLTGLDASVINTRTIQGTNAVDGGINLDAGDLSVAIPIPAFARAVAVCHVNPGTPPAVGRFDFDIIQGDGLGLAGAVCVTEYATGFGASMPQLAAPWWVPIVADASTVTIANTNNPPGDWRSFRVIFAIAI